MARRSFKDVRDGQPYAVEWPEWMVHCGNCGESVVMAELGQAYTVREAEQVFKKSGRQEGWRKVKGLWVCTSCLERIGSKDAV